MEFRQSPNFTPGKNEFKPIGFVIHGTAGAYEGAVDWLCTPPEKRVPVSYSSAHVVFAKDGRKIQLVKNSDISWHAGIVSNPTPDFKKTIPLGANPNSYYIGIENEWFVGEGLTEQQYANIVEYIISTGIKFPEIRLHSEITDYKADFKTKDGKIDYSIVNEIKRRLALAMAPPLTIPKVDTNNTNTPTGNDQSALIAQIKAKGSELLALINRLA